MPPRSGAPPRATVAALAAVAILAFAAAVPAALAQGSDTGSWLVRARALHLDSANKVSTGLNLSVNNKTFLEVDVSDFSTPNFAAELVLTYPQKQPL
jgi:outer membrane protein